MISVITPLYRTPAPVLARTWASLRAQTHTDWEWVVLDDSPDGDDAAWRQVYGFCADDRYRIRLLRGVHSGVIGAVKRAAFMAAEGSVLVELDHDDELTPDALTEISTAFHDPAVGFAYSDWAEINAAGESCRYPAGWAFGYGADRWDVAPGLWVMSAPPVNDVTIRHIVSAPNHVRAWRADVYRALGGHDPALDVADDYDLVVRTFLATRMTHIPRLLYRQHIGGHTAQRQRNERIQQLVTEISARHADAITARWAAIY